MSTSPEFQAVTPEDMRTKTIVSFTVAIDGDTHCVSFDGRETLYSVNKRIAYSSVRHTPGNALAIYNRYGSRLSRLAAKSLPR